MISFNEWIIPVSNSNAIDKSDGKNLITLLKELDAYEAFAFDHEADFLRSLVKKGKPTDLSSLSFNASGITVRWLDLSGQHLMDTIEVAAFIDWAKTHNEALA